MSMTASLLTGSCCPCAHITTMSTHAAAGEQTAGHEGEELSLASFANNSDSAMLLRVWNVKKSDPTVPVFVKSLNRRLAAIKPRCVLCTLACLDPYSGTLFVGLPVKTFACIL